MTLAAMLGTAYTFYSRQNLAGEILIGGNISQVNTPLPISLSNANILLNMDPIDYSLQLAYYLFDINPLESPINSATSMQNLYLPVLLFNSSARINITMLAKLTWSNGSTGPPTDFCFQPICNLNGPSVNGFEVAIIVIALLAISVGIGLLIYLWIKRRHAKKRLEEGPNKTILYPDDLTFVKNARSTKRSSIKLSNQDLRFPIVGQTSDHDHTKSIISSVHSIDGVVDSNTAKYNNEFVHIKHLSLATSSLRKKFINLLNLLRELRNENVNPVIGCYIDMTSMALVWEHCSRGSLKDVLEAKNIKLDWEFKLSLLTDLVKGMQFLHSSILQCHGSLKSTNCVVDGRWVLRVTDYALPPIYSIYGSVRTFKDNELLWTAPEALRDEELLQNGSQKGDVYSFAIVMQEVICRDEPYPNSGMLISEILAKLKKPPPLCRPQISQQEADAPPPYIQIMKRAWAENPEMRPSFEQIYHQFKQLNQGKKMNIVDHMFKMMEKYSQDLEDQVTARTEELELEKRRTEMLIARMLPEVVAKSLMSGQPVKPEAYDEVTIYFSDIVGFTTISAMSTPLQVVNLLNDLYTMFDETIDYYDVYKVETIGDAYMVASGLPVRNGKRHAGRLANKPAGA
ncbi:Retinal guanylyl cyclase 2 [Cichlidogyrus casuarinus]|uniref:guanylate cyclase n=1 Tax=Cichlidogyrus casuarinus TaxID=1844966 RepID=A0ABD2PY03_9PLAT